MGSKDNGQSFGLARAKHPEGPWEKYPNNPVFSQTGKAEDFDAGFLQHACPVKVGKQWRIYYNGNRVVPKSKERPVGREYAIGVAFVEE
jgi:beta-xylosidase